MRSLLTSLSLLLVLAASLSAGDLRLEDSSYRTVAYIREDGRVEDASFNTLGYIREGCTRVEDASFHTLGYIGETSIEDEDYNEMYRISDDGRITDSRFRTVARITSDGTVEDDTYSVILYTEGTDASIMRKIAAYLIFFSDVLEQED